MRCSRYLYSSPCLSALIKRDLNFWISSGGSAPVNFPGGSRVGSRCCAVAVDESNVVRRICGLRASLKEVVFWFFVCS